MINDLNTRIGNWATVNLNYATKSRIKIKLPLQYLATKKKLAHSIY